MEHTKRYSFTNYFYKVFYERVFVKTVNHIAKSTIKVVTLNTLQCA